VCGTLIPEPKKDFLDWTSKSGSGWYTRGDLLWGDSAKDIVAHFRSNFQTTDSREVAAQNTRYLFVYFSCYRGIGTFTMYCYEEVQRDAWLLRTVIPVKGAGDYDEHTLPHAGVLSFPVTGDAVTVVFETKELMTLKSVRVKEDPSSSARTVESRTSEP
jgi:hypothetical protein